MVEVYIFLRGIRHHDHMTLEISKYLLDMVDKVVAFQSLQETDLLGVVEVFFFPLDTVWKLVAVVLLL